MKFFQDGNEFPWVTVFAGELSANRKDSYRDGFLVVLLLFLVIYMQELKSDLFVSSIRVKKFPTMSNFSPIIYAYKSKCISH